MVMNQMLQFVKQMSGKLNSNVYTGLPNQADAAKIAYLRNLQKEMRSKDVLEVPFRELNVVVFDIETTGFFPYKGDRMLSIGGVKMKGDQVLEDEVYYSPIYSETAPSEEISRLTGITKDQLIEAPPIQSVLKDFYQFVKSDILVAHHSSHEKQFMKHATWIALKSNFEHRIIDTAFLTKIVEPEQKLVTLDDCCNHYGITIDHRHHALYDAIATAKLWSESIKRVEDLGFSNLKDVYTHIAKLK
ncbi:exonuclease domain-containing protein [Aquibacillus koreensis]|uniref:Exonuclease domain-containing protein n=1 Tax=Aquibacillus koreensis TaxID=279446 RepID=A0A9X3WNM4_9BACI|nr:exonuclease domain-containing protein [Aquibacillus koreensis]MCT2536128.1 exonuclease domain-containing protein [Aquibacillus koreensis]MDC3422053.1 exonuclease domain-containing protein [Aquibacillus koreensis]